mgnify:FL=1
MIKGTLPGFKIKELSQETFNKFRELIYRETGISMGNGKRILVSNRLRKRLIELDMDNYESYYKYLVNSLEGKSELANFIDAISTNETYFYRGDNQFEALERFILPELFSKKSSLKIWSAGCSTGEEPYTIKMVIMESKKSNSWNGNVQIYATDISKEAIEKAKEGTYSGRTLNFMPEIYLKKYFIKKNSEIYVIKDEIKKNIIFLSHNLLKDSPPSSSFDIIFCRNVMIYFDRITQKKLVDDYFAPVLNRDGYLFIGHSESLIGKSEKFQYAHILRSPIYILNNKTAGKGKK